MVQLDSSDLIVSHARIDNKMQCLNVAIRRWPFAAIARVESRRGHQENKKLALLVFLFLEGCLVILTAIKGAENRYPVSIHLERDHNPFSVAGYS